MSKRGRRREKARDRAEADATDARSAPGVAKEAPEQGLSESTNKRSFRRFLGAAADRFRSVGFREQSRGVLAGGAFALVFGCATNAISSSGDMNIAFAQIAIGTLLAFTFIVSLNRPALEKTIYLLGVLATFSAIGWFVYNQAVAKQAEDRQRTDREIKLAKDLNEVRDRLRETADELREQKAWRKTQERNQKLSMNPAPLIPAADYTLKGACQKNGSVNVILGTTSYGSSVLPYKAVVIRGKTAILVEAGPDGVPLVSFDVHNIDGKLMARVTKNAVFVPPQFATLVPRSDLHHIEVIDTKGEKIFTAYFANEKTIKFTGIFYENGMPFSIDDTSKFGGLEMTGGQLCDNQIGLEIK